MNGMRRLRPAVNKACADIAYKLEVTSFEHYLKIANNDEILCLSRGALQTDRLRHRIKHRILSMLLTQSSIELYFDNTFFL